MIILIKKIKNFFGYLRQVYPSILVSSITYYILLMIIPLSTLIISILHFLNVTTYEVENNQFIGNWVTIIVALGSIFWVSSKAVNALHITTDIIYQDVLPRQGIKKWLMTFLIMLLIIVIIIVQIIILLFLNYFFSRFIVQRWQFLFAVIQFIGQFLMIMLTCSIIYKYIIPIKVYLKQTFVLSVLVTSCWYLVTFFFKVIYQNNQHSAYQLLYGSASSLFIFIVWIYLIVYIFVFGIILRYYLNKITNQKQINFLKVGYNKIGTK